MENDLRRSAAGAASPSRMSYGFSGKRGLIAQICIVGPLLVVVPVHAAPLQPSSRSSCAEAFIGTSSDNRQLMALAPPGDTSMGGQSYGDAPFARLHYERRRGRASASASVDCRSPQNRKTTVKTYYMYSPAYLSAPQVAAGDARNRILPRPTVLPWIVDSLLNPPD